MSIGKGTAGAAEGAEGTGAVAADYGATGLTLRQHPMALLRPALDRLGLDDTRRFRSARQGQTIRLPGLVLMRQRPGTAKGVVFVTIEDEFGDANLVVNEKVGAEHHRALIAARLLIAEGRVERTEEHAEVPILHLIVRRLTDRSDLLDRLQQFDAAGSFNDAAWADRTSARASNSATARLG